MNRYVDTAGSTSNDGLATGSGAFQTIGAAVFVAYQQIDMRPAGLTSLVTAGQTFNEQVFMGSRLTGTNVITIKGNGGQFTWTNDGLPISATMATLYSIRSIGSATLAIMRASVKYTGTTTRFLIWLARIRSQGTGRTIAQSLWTAPL